MLVLDQRFISRPPEGKEFILLPHAFIYENIKGSKWQEYFLKRFDPYKNISDRLLIAKSSETLIEEEMDTWKPIFSVVNERASTVLQSHVQNNILNNTMLDLCLKLKARGVDGINMEAAHEHKLMVTASIKVLENNSPKEQLLELKKTPMRDNLQFIFDYTKALLSAYLIQEEKKAGINTGDLSLLQNSDSMHFRKTALTIVYKIQTHQISKYANMQDEKHTHDLVDDEYILIASYCRDLITEDKKMIERYECLKALIAMEKSKKSPIAE